MTAARRNIYIDDDINKQIEILVAGSGGRHGELRYVFNSLLRDSPKMKKLLKATDIATVTTKAAPKTSRFIKPEFGELLELFWQSGQFTDYDEAKDKASQFINHYDSNGWKVGKNPMRSWKATVSQWVARRKKDERSGQVQGQAKGNSQRGGNGQQSTPLQRTIADYDEGMAYARTLENNLEAQGNDGQEIRGALD